MATAIRGMAGSEFELRCPLQKERASYRKSFLFGFRGESKCSAEMYSAPAKVFTCGENACAAQTRRGPEGPLDGIPVNRPKAENIDFNRPLQKEKDIREGVLFLLE